MNSAALPNARPVTYDELGNGGVGAPPYTRPGFEVPRAGRFS